MAVAAVLVAGIRLHFLDILLHLKHRGPNVIPCDASFRKGEEMGWFQHGSTIIVFAPDGFKPCEHVKEGTVIRTGQPLLRLPERQDASGLVSLSRICSPGKRALEECHTVVIL